jgi:hypothetical protein
VNKARFTSAIVFAMLWATAAAAETAPPQQQAAIAGWIERISLPDQGMIFDAKLDTGADSSALNGKNVERYSKGSQSFVRFRMTDDSGKSVQLEAPVRRVVRIKRSGNGGDSRPVVQLKVCVAGQTVEADFTVADRADLNYQILIGRNVLAGRVLVDASRQRIVSDRCPLGP